MYVGMHWLTKHTNKECHSDMHSITQPHYSTTIPSSGTPVGTKFTATYYVGMVVE